MVLRHSFGKKFFNSDNFSFNFLFLQNESYNLLLNDYIPKTLKSIFPIYDSYNLASLDYKSYRIEDKNINLEDCRLKSLNYELDLYVTFRLMLFSINEKTGEREIKSIKEQEVYLCSIPKLTKYGTFNIHGVDRVITGQLHQSPRVNFTKKLKSNNNYVKVFTLAPYYGSRVEFSIENKKTIMCRIDKKKKFSAYNLLIAFGAENKDIISSVYDKIEVEKHSDNFFNIRVDFSSLNFGSVLSFDIYNEKEELLYRKNTLISKNLIKNLSSIGKILINKSDLLGSYLYEDVEVNGKEKIDFATVIDESNISLITNIKKFKIVNALDTLFNSFFLDQINENRDRDRESIVISVAKSIYPGDSLSYEAAERLLKKIFFNKSYYNLLKVGRYQINKILGRTSESPFIELDDLLISSKILIFHNSYFSEDDDHLNKRRVKNLGELIDNQFRIGLTAMVKQSIEKIDVSVLDTATPSTFIFSNLVNKPIKEFLISELCQFADQTNLVSQLSHIRKISALGRGGIAKNRATPEVRDIHYTHYGRICPVETPDGKHVGLINNYAMCARLNEYGLIISPYRKVKDCKITDEVVYLTADEEAYHYLGNLGNFNEDGVIKEDIVPARYNSEFVLVSKDKINYVDVYSGQIVSIASNLIPFLERNETSRALMGCNMQKQAVPLLYEKAPMVGTGIEKEIANQSSYVIKSETEGEVVYVDSKVIYIKNSDPKNLDESIKIYHLEKFKRSNRSTLFNQKPLVNIGDFVKKGQILTEGCSTADGEVALGKDVLVAFMPWNGYNYEDSIIVSERLLKEDTFTSVHIEEFEVAVRDTKLGEEEITRDIYGLSDDAIKNLDESGIIELGSYVKGGDILVGKVTPKSEAPITSEEKLLRAIFGEKISDKKDSSLRIPVGFSGVVVDVKILTKRGRTKDSRALLIEKYQVKKLTEEKEKTIKAYTEICDSKLDDIIKEENIKLENDSKISIHKKFSLKFSSKNKPKVSELKNEYERSIEKIEKDFIDKVSIIMDGDDLQGGVLKVIKVFVATRSRIQPGDKMAGRHGNKGVVSKIAPTEDMPYMEDGTPIDIILNSIGVVGRMNLGQIFEVNLGLASFGLTKKIRKMIQDCLPVRELKNFILEVANENSVADDIKKMNDSQIMDLARKYAKDGFYFTTPIFDGAQIEEIERLLELAGFDKSGKCTLYDGKTGKPFDKKIAVGYQHILKLHHLVDEKMHARSTGPYSLVTQQPLGGKAQQGGQRFGEMETWALEAYGAAYSLQEMLTYKSDDVSGRTKVVKNIIENGYVSSENGIPESFNVLLKELKSIGLDINLGVDKIC